MATKVCDYRSAFKKEKKRKEKKRKEKKRKEKKRKEKVTLFSDHNGSLPRRQPGAMTIGHNPKGK